MQRHRLEGAELGAGHMLNPLRHLPAAERKRLLDLRRQADCAEHHAKELQGAERAEVLSYGLRCRAQYLAALPSNRLNAHW